jgi:hypothetical protein
VAGGLIVFLYCLISDLFPAGQTWLNVSVLVVVIGLVVGLRTRVGSTLLGRQVVVSSRSFPLSLRWRLLRMAPIFGCGIAAALIVLLLHVPHGQIYYGALAGLYIIFLGPRFQLWLLRRQDED